MNKERFRVTGKITRLLGSESVADDTTALLEILKNCHDADALSVTIRFVNFEAGLGKIIIKEEKGDGMTYDEIKNKFLVIGTYSKTPTKKNQVQKTKRLNRNIIGQKGVGRFALEKLGKYVKITSKPFGNKDKFAFNIDWNRFTSPGVTVDQIPISILPGIRENKEDSGLEIEISKLNGDWTQEKFDEFEKEIKALILPKKLQPRHPFRIFLEAKNFGIDLHEIETKLEEKAFFRLESVYDGNKITIKAERLKKNYIISHKITEFDSYIEEGKRKEASKLECGPVKLFVHYFPQWNKGDKLHSEYYDKAIKFYGETFHKLIPNTMEDNHGVKIYKDGLREFKYGDKGYDWTHRETITRNFSGTVQAERLLGFCLISSAGNSEIKPTVNRREAEPNQAFRDLQDFVIISMLELDRKIHNERRQKLQAYENSVKPTVQNLKKAEEILKKAQVSKAIQKIEEETGESFDFLEIIPKAREIAESKERQHDEMMTQDEITLANATTGDYLGRLYHDYVDPVVGLIEDQLSALQSYQKRRDVDNEIKEIFEKLTKYWNMIIVVFDAIDGLNSGLGIEEFYKREKTKINLKEEIDRITENLGILFQFDEFRLNNDVNDKLELKIFGPVIYSLLYNVISNSIKAFKQQRTKNSHGNIISIRTRLDKKKISIFLSDNSNNGISESKWSDVFKERISTTTKQKILPGHGIGLYIIKRMLTYINGEITIVKPILGTGTTFKVEIPNEYIYRN